ncbi:MAG: hypothetical protein GEV08_15905 [Acidimicrobiia bacterium]|nr:hypothetical protein [Acidimicrobiia bacterium]
MASAVVVAAGPPSVGAVVGPVRAQSVDVGTARARVDATATARESAESRLAGAREEAAVVAGTIEVLSGDLQQVVEQMGQAQRQASRLAVDAYMHGGSTDELRLLDAEASTAAALRLHLTTGRVDQAREAAAQLLSLRDETDDELGAQAEALARANQAVADAERDLAEVIASELYANQLLAEAEAAAEAEREAEQERQADQARAEAEADARAGSRDEAEADAPAPRQLGSTAPAPTPHVAVPVHSDPWEQLRQCESGGNYQSKSNPLYRGAYQFGYSTWESVGGTGDPADAPPEEQDARAYALYLLRGWSPWPNCGAGLPPG